VATDNLWGKFRRWRRHRPFWGGLFLILSAVELYLSANLSLGGLELHLGPQGFLSYLIPLMLLVAGVLIWFTPAQRLFYAIIGLLAALYSFVGLNLGGFFFGMLLGIIGGALVIAWTPRRPKPGAGPDGPPDDGPTDKDEDLPEDVGDDIFDERRDIDETQRIEVAGHDDRPHEPVRPATRSFDAAPRPTLSRLGRSPKALVLAIVPLAVTATILVVGSNLQASAAVECPEGLPSASATTSSKAAAAAAKKTAAPTTTAAAAPPAAAKTTAAAGATTTAPAAAAAPAEDGNAVLDGIGDFLDGVGNLLGINDDETSSPSASPTPSDTTAAPADPDPTATTKPADDGTKPTTAPTTTSGETKPTGTASALPAATGDEIPCLGARVEGLVASADDIPPVSKKPGLMEVDSLTMHFATYDGVVDMPVQGGGSYKALKFTMKEADNEPFKLTIDEPNGGTTVISSKKLVTKDNVKFYTPEFKGNLFGVIPVTFTPDSPPPLMLDFLWFTKAKIQLGYVRCDTLTGEPLKVEG
jgi:hypothetical protein